MQVHAPSEGERGIVESMLVTGLCMKTVCMCLRLMVKMTRERRKYAHGNMALNRDLEEERSHVIIDEMETGK
jgi:hypothetical protein